MPQEVQRGGEAEPDGPRKHPIPDTAGSREKSSEKPTDRDQSKNTQRTPGKVEGK